MVTIAEIKRVKASFLHPRSSFVQISSHPVSGGTTNIVDRAVAAIDASMAGIPNEPITRALSATLTAMLVMTIAAGSINWPIQSTILNFKFTDRPFSNIITRNPIIPMFSHSTSAKGIAFSTGGPSTIPAKICNQHQFCYLMCTKNRLDMTVKIHIYRSHLADQGRSCE